MMHSNTLPTPQSVRLSYGEQGYSFPLDIPGVSPEVFLPANPPALEAQEDAFKHAVRNPIGSLPLADIVTAALEKPRNEGRPPKVVIAVADHTRPVPDHLLIPWITAELGVPDACVTILIGTGTHRGSTREELQKMLGSAADRFHVVNHDCQDAQSLVFVGKSSCGGECWMNKHWIEADLRLTTGFIEPHFYAGFSGGSKALIPGIAGLDTVRHFHRASLIEHPKATWARIFDNPLQQLTREMAALAPPHFIVNVTLNHAKAITGIFAGDLTAAHNAGCEAALEEATVPVPRLYPIVVTTNSGFPLDQNFYQTVKGISAASRIVEPGGLILVFSRCNKGLPLEGEFAEILSEPISHSELHSKILATKVTRHDQWQVQTLMQCLEKARIVLVSELSPEDRLRNRTEHTDDPIAVIREFVAARAGGPVAIAILPEGPLSIACPPGESPH
jgi:nickel-dependent lactate racemase